MIINPAFNKNNIPVIFSTDENYVPLLAVTVKSVLANISTENNYDIVVLNSGISQELQDIIIDFANDIPNASIRFFDVSHFIKKFGAKIFYVGLHFSEAAYYRLFIPEIFKSYDRVVYLDCDMVVNIDVAELYNMDLEGQLICATRDLGCHTDKYAKTGQIKDYMEENILGIKNWDNYFQSAVMVLDLEQIKPLNFVEKAIEELIRVKEPLFVEQCILNVLYEGRVKLLSWQWDFNVFGYLWNKKIIYKKFSKNLIKELETAEKTPYIIHYNCCKPYEFDVMDGSFAPFWHYAKQTPFLEEFYKKRIDAKSDGKMIHLRWTHKLKLLFSLFSGKYIN